MLSAWETRQSKLRTVLFADVVLANALGPDTAFSALKLLENFGWIGKVVVVDDHVHVRVSFCHGYGSPAEYRDSTEVFQGQHVLEAS